MSVKTVSICKSGEGFSTLQTSEPYRCGQPPDCTLLPSPGVSSKDMSHCISSSECRSNRCRQPIILTPAVTSQVKGKLLLATSFSCYGSAALHSCSLSSYGVKGKDARNKIKEKEEKEDEKMMVMMKKMSLENSNQPTTKNTCLACHKKKKKRLK